MNFRPRHGNAARGGGRQPSTIYRLEYCSKYQTARKNASKLAQLHDLHYPANVEHPAQLGHVRSMNVVSTRDSLKAAWSRIFWCIGMVVLTPSTRISASARFMQAMASARVG